MMCKKSMSQPAGLISVLLDREADFGDRHDAAMDLSELDGEAVVLALNQIIEDKTEDPDIVEECEQSLLDLKRRQK